MGTPGYENGFRLSLRPEKLQEPLQRKKPTIHFVNSMSDLFHEQVPDEYIDQVFEVIRQASQHTFQILTKRAERLSNSARRWASSRLIGLPIAISNTRSLVNAAIYPSLERSGIHQYSVASISLVSPQRRPRRPGWTSVWRLCACSRTPHPRYEIRRLHSKVAGHVFTQPGPEVDVQHKA